ncbi:hypothetical protein Hanom_Chr13g01218081 [Helianthus anomalus]
MKTVIWPPTYKENTISLMKKIPEGGLKKLHFWFGMTDQVDLLTVSLQDLKVLAQNQFRSTENYEAIAKEWTVVVAGVLQVKKQGFTGLRNTSGSSGSRG